MGQTGATAQISGLVSDPSGAVVPNARITATQTNTGLVRRTLSDPDGNYVLSNLPVGPYRLEVQAGGFNTYVRTGIVLEVSNVVTVNVRLEVGRARQEVEVTGNASMVQAQTTSVGQVMDNRRVLDLPLNGRQATDLIMLMSMSTDTTDSNLSDLKTSKNHFSADSISVAGRTVQRHQLSSGWRHTHGQLFKYQSSFPLPGCYPGIQCSDQQPDSTERHRLELRFEFFNALNRPNFSIPDSTVTDATFGQILSDVSPRILQFGLK